MEAESELVERMATTDRIVNTTNDKPFVEAEKDYDAILARLSDMFGDVLSSDSISTICNLYKWKMDDCIDALIRLNSEKESKVSGPNRNSYEQLNNESSSSITKNQTNLINSKSLASTQFEVFQMESGNRNLGAIPKWQLKANNCMPRGQTKNIPNSVRSSASASALQQRNQQSRSNTKHLDPVCNKIQSGYKVLVLMRGAPGSGKSHLAQEIVDVTIPSADYRNHICSTDDYFFDSNGNYVFRIDELATAHDWNRRRVRTLAMNGWAPIIVDNTNMKMWEMFDYVKIAVDFGYIVEIVEPRTPWSKSAGKLAGKNRHGVPKDKIQRMLDGYERTTVAQLFQAMNIKYNSAIPQFRLVPPLVPRAPPTIPIKFAEPESNRNEIEQNNDEPDSSANEADRVEEEEGSDEVFSAEVPDNNWTSYEKESESYWRAKQTEDNLQEVISNLPKPPRRAAGIEKESADNKEKSLKERIFDKWKAEIINSNDKPTNESTIKLDRHSVGCENENKNFATLRQIYSNREVVELWELFEKCQGNIDWVVDILLKYDSCVNQRSEKSEDSALNCDCNFVRWEDDTVESNEEPKAEEELIDTTSPKKQRVKREKAANRNPDELESLRKTIEQQIVLGDQYYSERTKKIRNFRHGINNTTEPCPANIEQPTEDNDGPTQSDSKENDDESTNHEDDEVVEIVLGDLMVDQLTKMFEVDDIPKDLMKNLKSNVFIPKSLAYQLYLMWMESVHNQIEEQRYQTLREDEELAKMIEQQQNKKATNVKSLGEELVTQFYSKDQNSWDSNGHDLASQLTKLKLSEQFPNIGQQTLLETFGTLDNCYQETVQILQDTYPNQPAPKIDNNVTKETSTVDGDSEKANPDLAFATGSNMNNDDAKKLALHNFETNRNMSVHHSQLKAECYQKAKEAIQKGNTAVAVYYSQIADLHKQKVDSYNNSAANCIVVVHDMTQNNPDFIDLHYLHQVEAEQCLDVFIDKHIRKLKSLNKTYKYIFIITGRGLHSAGGISIIKNRVKSRLKDRNLNWSELNPGLLKVKVFCTSKFTNRVSMC